MKHLITTVAIVLASVALAEPPTITGVTAQQRYPWNGKVDIAYTVTGDIAAEAKARASIASLKVMVIDTLANTTNVATQLSGDASLSAGTHNIVWDMDAEGLSFKSSNVVFMVVCEMAAPTYYVIDLSGGANATSYPIEYLDSPPSEGFRKNIYKSTKLVLRKIEAGTFNMGGSKLTTLSRPFYCGIFEVTLRQWEQVMNSGMPTDGSRGISPMYASYNTIRGSSNGAGWPASSAVDGDSFLGKLQARTGVNFDLPTEAQWEYACRAGTTTIYSYGDGADENYMWYLDNSGSQTSPWPVGDKQPNAWGLYDMHGNMWEWCLDWYASSLAGGTDPQGSPSGSARVLRGGYWRSYATNCTSSYRYSALPSASGGSYHSIGFRLCRTMSTDEHEQCLLCWGKSGNMIIDIVQGARTVALADQKISYSTSWANGADTVAVVEVNGETLVLSAGSGYVNWTPRQCGIYVLTHKVLSGGEQVGETLTTTFHVESYTDTPILSPMSDTIFNNTSQEVTITCDTSDATILYTTDGSNPAENGIAYKGAFMVYGTCTIRSIACKPPLLDSEEASVTLTRAEGLSEAANLYGYLMETDGSYPWTVVTDVSHDGVSCVRSGAIGNGGTTHLTASVRKTGTVSFWWKAACEDADVEDDETYYYDYGVFLVDDVEKAWIAGHDTGWRKVVVEVPTGGKHVLRWEYRKDGATSYAPDCVWLDQVQWIPADGGGHTLTTPEPVPYAWLSGYGLGGDSDFETAAKGATGKRGGDGRALQVWQDYVAGTDPTNAASVFTAGIEFVGGVPQVTWSPNLNTNGIERSYTIWGRTNLTDGADWECPTNAAHRFFKVTVEMP